MEDSRRHRFLWKLVYYPVRLYMRLRYNYRPNVQPVAEPSLIVSNHATDPDPLLLALTIKNFAYFVASEHVFRRHGKLLLWAQGPISRMKGTTAADTALTIIRRLRKGFSVALFPEGNRTFNGANSDIIESTAKLARVSGASLVTHRFRGGYFTSPRWSGNSVRRGKFTGEIVRVLSPAELKAMTPAEIADVIRADIFENAYETQKEWNARYKGRNLAEHIERALCLCPGCGRLGTLVSKGNRFSCRECGLSGVYTEFGYLEGDALPFHTVLDWDRWQAQELQKRADDAGVACIAEDTDMTLDEIGDDYGVTPVAQGRMAIYRDRLAFEDHVFPLSGISGMNINGPQILVFTADGRNYTVTSKQIRNVRKYLTLFHALTAPEKLLSL